MAMISNKIVLNQLIYNTLSIISYIIGICVMFFNASKSRFNRLSFNKIFIICAINDILATALY